MRVAAGFLIALPFLLLPLLWAFSVIPLGGLLPLLTAPLAIRLGERASHRSGATLREVRRDALIYLLAFAGLFVLGISFELPVPL